MTARNGLIWGGWPGPEAATDAGLTAFHRGDLEAADAAFTALEVGAAASGDVAAAGRASSLRGRVARRRGQLGLASDRYREAARRLTEAGELHAAAMAELDLGSVLIERGRASDALVRLAAASRGLGGRGGAAELCAVELERAAALLQLGQVEEARTAAAAAIAHAGEAPPLRALAQLAAADVQRRLGDEPAAIAGHREALAIAVQHGDRRAQLAAQVALAEAGQRPDDPAAVDALCAGDDDRDRWTLARGRLALRDPGSVRPSGSLAEATAALARECRDVARRADDADRLERGFRGHAIAAQLAQRARDAGLARDEAERAQIGHAAWSAVTAPAFRAALDGDPDLARLAAPDAGGPAVPRGPHGPPAELRRLLALSRRLHSEASVERIVDEVVDAALELTGAERGFLLLRQPAGDWAAAAARNFVAGDLDAAAAAAPSLPRSIAERAAHTGEPVALRTVLAVPLRQRGAITGSLYVDHRLREGAFAPPAAGALSELADLAAIAIENARSTGELRQTVRELDARQARLAGELAERDAALVRLQAQLPERDRLRHRHDRIVGRSAAMVKMLGVIDRAAATMLPVVILGEPGTGKELVARTLHDHGPRADGAFVAIDCAALPEPLLEAELFGHAAGGLPGADRERPGVFEIARGGTLFLDEIAATSPAIQARLLRVLQDGVVRRIGDARAREVDVRVVAASPQPLAQLATAGRFREDLRLRLDVITVPVPPLRDRDGDLPLLIEHLLARLAAGRPAPRLTRAAHRALAQHRWPGNVRELENALARGVALGRDVIDVDDLPDAIARAVARPEPVRPAAGDDLRLRPALAATEQAYIASAMARARGNQTAAARLLGLSRFGLQKKLRRLAGQAEAAGDDEDTDD